MENDQAARQLAHFPLWYGACLSTAPREIFEGGVPLNKLITVVVCVFFIMGTAQVSDALTYQFDEEFNSTPFQATMELIVSNNKLTIKLQNTSLESAGPAISGFGVSLLNYPSIYSGMTWTLLAADDKDVSARWYKYGVSNYQLNFYAISAVLDGLYNPKYKGLTSDDRTTPALFTAEFKLGTPELNENFTPIIYVGNIGLTNTPYVTGRLVAAPEPGTLLLLGLGLIGIGIIMREML